MAHVLTQEAPPEETKKQGKKLAKQEAKLMLRLEEAKKDVAKAEQKEARAREKLDARRAELQQLQEQLSALRASPPEQQNGHAAPVEVEVPQASQEAAAVQAEESTHEVHEE